MAEVLVPLTCSMPPNAIEQLTAFSMRFDELWKNWESLKLAGIRFGGGFAQEQSRIVGPGCGIETHRLKGFYLDFRVFWATDERTEYTKVTGLLGKHCRDPGLAACLAENRRQWNEAGMLKGWHGMTADDLFKIVFNAALFHTDSDKQSRLRDITQLMGHEQTHHELTYCAYQRMLVVRNIRWVITPLLDGQDCVRLPDQYAKSIAE